MRSRHFLTLHPFRSATLVPPIINAAMRSIVGKLLDEGLIRESQSPYAAPALLVKKKDLSYRLVIDYKRLNSVTIKDNYPLPNMEVALQTLGTGYHFFSKLDLKSGFWQLPINEKDRHKTAFTTSFGLFEWNVLPQGLRNSPPSFQRIMNKVLADCADFSLVYLDDIVVFSTSYDQHLVDLEKIFGALQSHNLTLTPAKCEIARDSIEYLGHIVSGTRLTPLPDKIKSIASLPEPKSLAQANRFVGALSWYRKFLPNFASIAAPLHSVTNLSRSNKHKFKWGADQSKAFSDLKNLLTSHPLFLHFPNDDYPVLLSTDASKVGLGGILYQEINNERKILYYHSELLSSVQRRYSTIELEALAIFKCINRMRFLLLGREIIIYTDNCPLCNMMNKNITNRRVQNISLLLQEFNIREIVHVKGKLNCLPDYLSRHPIPNEDELLNPDYGLECPDEGMPRTSSPLQRLNAVVTRSKAKAMIPDSTSSSTVPPPPDSNPSPSIDDTTSPTVDPDSFDVKQLVDQQRIDPDIQKIVRDLQQHPSTSFVYQDEILYKLVSLKREKVQRQVIYLPRSMVKSLLHSYHDNPLIGGHFAVHRTLNKIRDKFWWPNMKQSVNDYVKSCVVCQAHNIDRQKRPGHLQPITVPRRTESANWA